MADPPPTICTAISSIIYRVAGRGTYPVAEQDRYAPAFAARHLGCDTGEPLLRIDRLYFDAEDAPVELAVSYFDPEHYSYRVKLRRRSRWPASPA